MVLHLINLELFSACIWPGKIKDEAVKNDA